MSVLSPEALQPARLAGGLSRPVLAVVAESYPYEPILDRAVIASRGLAAPVRIALLHPRIGLTTDPALLAWAARRRSALLADVRDALGRRAPEGALTTAELVPYAIFPLGNPTRQAWRACEALAMRCSARIVVAPQHLAEAAAAERVVAVVGVPTEVVTEAVR